MTVVEGGTTAVATANTETVTTASFTPAAGSLLLAIAACGNGDAFTTALGAVTDSVGGTWTRLAGEVDAFGATAEIWARDAGAAPAATTVTYNPGGGGPADEPTSGLLVVAKYLLGAKPLAAQPGATALNGGTTAYTKAIVVQATGSLIFGAHGSHSRSDTLTGNANTTILGQTNGPSGDTACAYRATNVGTPGSITLGFTTAVFGVQRQALVEILPASYVPRRSYYRRNSHLLTR